MTTVKQFTQIDILSLLTQTQYGLIVLKEGETSVFPSVILGNITVLYARNKSLKNTSWSSLQAALGLVFKFLAGHFTKCNV